VNESRTPQAADIAWAKRVVEAYEEARERGEGAVTVDGRWLTVHQYTAAQQALRMAQALELSS
jgi:citrate lyase subunit beta/citryl-CoA lyase